MTRFQLVFRENGVDKVETRDNNMDGEPHIDGKLVVDGAVYVIRGVEWLVTADHIGGTRRFLCTLVAERADWSGGHRATKAADSSAPRPR